MHPLSDRARPLVATLALAGLVATSAWWIHLHHSGDVGYLGLARDPARFDEQPKVLSLVRVDEVVDAAHYRVAHGTLVLAVEGSSAGLVPGDEVTVIGRWEADGPHLEAERVVPAPHRSDKRRLGLAGLGSLALLLPLWFRPTRRGLAFRG